MYSNSLMLCGLNTSLCIQSRARHGSPCTTGLLPFASRPLHQIMSILSLFYTFFCSTLLHFPGAQRAYGTAISRPWSAQPCTPYHMRHVVMFFTKYLYVRVLLSLLSHVFACFPRESSPGTPAHCREASAPRGRGNNTAY